MSVSYLLVLLLWVISARGSVEPVANDQGITLTKSANDSVLGAYAGQEPAYKDDEGDITGPSTYVFHFLPDGRCFMDWRNSRPRKSGRTFGVYTITSGGKSITVQATFVPSMDSLSVEPPATDYFETFTFRFSNRKVMVKYMEDSNAPTFLVSRAALSG